MMKKIKSKALIANIVDKKLNTYNISRENYNFHQDRLLELGFRLENIQMVLLRKKGIERANMLFEHYHQLLNAHFTHAQISVLCALSANVLVLQQSLVHIHEWLQKYSHEEILRMTACSFSAQNIELLTQYQEAMEQAGFSPRHIADILSRSSGYQIIRDGIDLDRRQKAEALEAIDLNDIEDESFKSLINDRITPVARRAFGFFNSEALPAELPVVDFELDLTQEFDV